jgi:hypothetical protein
LLGKVFSNNSPLSDLKHLYNLNTKFIILDNSEVGTVIKHKIEQNTHEMNNITFLGRSGSIMISDIKIVYINGLELLKYLGQDEYCYTGGYYSREDVNRLILPNEKTKTDILLVNTMPSVLFDELSK